MRAKVATGSSLYTGTRITVRPRIGVVSGGGTRTGIASPIIACTAPQPSQKVEIRISGPRNQSNPSSPSRSPICMNTTNPVIAAAKLTNNAKLRVRATRRSKGTLGNMDQ